MHLLKTSLCLAATAWALGSSAQAAIFKVGPDPQCDFDRLEPAIAEAGKLPGQMHWIRLSAGDYHGVSVAILGDLSIRGGYLDCSESAIQAGKSTLNGNGNDAVIYVVASPGVPMRVDLEHLVLQGGGRPEASDGGGLAVWGPAKVSIRHTDIQRNRAREGGGVHARSGAEVLLLEGSKIRYNAATYSGGGLFARASLVRMRAEEVVVHSNSAGLWGGGIALFEGAQLQVGSYGEPSMRLVSSAASIVGNSAPTGGGIFLTGAGTTVDAEELTIGANTAVIGGGLYAGAGAGVFMRRATGGVRCGPTMHCSAIRGNSADADGGAIHLTSNAVADLAHTRIDDNAGASVFSLDGGGMALDGATVSGNRLRGDAPATLRITAEPAYTRFVYVTELGNRISSSPATLAPLLAAAGPADIALAGSAFETGVSEELLSTGACNRAEITAAAYVDVARGNFRPLRSGPLADQCGTGAVEGRPLDAGYVARCSDVPGPEVPGPCDIGAFEAPPPELTHIDITGLLPAPGRADIYPGEPVAVRVLVLGTDTRPRPAVMRVNGDMGGESCETSDATSAGDRGLEFECTLHFTQPGAQTIGASYAGTQDHAGSATGLMVEVKRPAEATISVTGREPAGPTQVGSATRFDLRVTGGETPPTGTVTVDAGAGGQCDAVLDEGQGSCSLAALAPGMHEVTITYPGDTRHQPASTAYGELIVQGQADLRVQIDNHATHVGDSTIYDVHVFNDGPADAYDVALLVTTDAPVLDASWECVEDQGVPCDGKKEASDRWQARLPIPAGKAMHYRLSLQLAAGIAPVRTTATARLLPETADPSTDNNTATDGPDSRTPPSETTISVIGREPAGPTQVGSATRFDLRVTGGETPPTGTVTVDAGAGGRCNAVLAEGEGTCSLAALAPGIHNVTITYPGDTRHQPASTTDGDLIVQGQADLRVQIDNHATHVGDSTIYDVHVFNDGPADAYNVALLVTTDAPVLDASWECVEDQGVPCGDKQEGSDRWLADFPIPAGKAMHYRLSLQLAAGTASVHTAAAARLLPETADPSTDNNTATDGPDPRTPLSENIFESGFE
jgi:hypothetical protein